MGVTLYYLAPSPPARTALLVCRALGLDVDVKILNLLEKEHLTPEFLKINPQHTVPTLVDDDLTIWESGAISAYLVNAYGENDDLYPKDPKKRAVVDQRLHFSNGTLFSKLKDICYPVFYLGKTTIPAETLTGFREGLRLLNIFLEGQKYVAGDQLTIADYALAPIVSSYAATGWSLDEYPNIVSWLEVCKSEMPGYEEINQEGANYFGDGLKSRLEEGQI